MVKEVATPEDEDTLCSPATCDEEPPIMSVEALKEEPFYSPATCEEELYIQLEKQRVKKIPKNNIV